MTKNKQKKTPSPYNKVSGAINPLTLPESIVETLR